MIDESRAKLTCANAVAFNGTRFFLQGSVLYFTLNNSNVLPKEGEKIFSEQVATAK